MADLCVQLKGIGGEEIIPKTTASQVIIERANGKTENVEESIDRLLSRLKCLGGEGILKD